MTDTPIVFVDDGTQWLNVALIETISDKPARGATAPERVVVVAGREYDSIGTAQELIDKLDELGNKMDPNHYPDLDKPRFGAPGRGIPD